MKKFRVISEDLEKISFFKLESIYGGSNADKWKFYNGSQILMNSVGKDDICFVDMFSGLYDRYGNEIYENDLILIGQYLMKVEFKDGNFLIKNMVKSTENVNVLEYLSDHDRGTFLIGNIYFNSHLIEKLKAS